MSEPDRQFIEVEMNLLRNRDCLYVSDFELSRTADGQVGIEIEYTFWCPNHEKPETSKVVHLWPPSLVDQLLKYLPMALSINPPTDLNLN
jgi:hypothetical protein